MHLSIYALRRSICASLHFALDIPIRSCPNRIDMRPFGARDGLCPTNPNFRPHSRPSAAISSTLTRAEPSENRRLTRSPTVSAAAAGITRPSSLCTKA